MRRAGPDNRTNLLSRSFALFNEFSKYGFVRRRNELAQCFHRFFYGNVEVIDKAEDKNLNFLSK